MDNNEQVLLRPYTTSVTVNVHPHRDGDVVSVQWVDANGHRYLMALEPEAAHNLGADLTEATTSEAIAAQADSMREQQ